MHGLSIRSGAKLQALQKREWREHSSFGFKGDVALDRDWFSGSSVFKQKNRVNKKSPSGIRPRRCCPSPQGAKYVMVTQDTSPNLCGERCEGYLFGQAKTGGLGQVTTPKNKKSHKGIRPHHYSPSPQGARYVTITQNMSPGKAEVCNKNLFGRAKTRGLEQVTIKKQEKAQGHWTLPFFPLPSGCKIQHGHLKCH